MKKTKHSARPSVRVTPAVATLPTKSTPVTPAERRETALLRALKKRADRLEAMDDQKEAGWSIARIARRHRVSPARVRALLQEYSVFAEENSLRWRIRYQEVPRTLLPGDKGRYRAYCRAIRAYRSAGCEYQGPAAAATLGDMGLRLLVQAVLRCQRERWKNL